MKNRSQKTVCIILSLLLIAGISGCKWQSFDSVFRRGSSSSSGSRGGSGGTPLDINMIAITGATVTNEPMHESYGDVVYGGNNDEGPFLQQNLPVTVSSFRIAQTELTYTKWYEVYTWAVKHGYTFLYPGREGSRGMDGASPKGTGEPVTMISWRDAIVWCNAASEYEGLVYVYLNNAEVVKNACNSDADNCYISSTANGYRLPTSAEWEFAARGGSPTEIEWSYRYSGTDNQLELGSYAVYDLDDSIESNNTSPVKTKLPNSCGLYDMSGNVFEYCFDSCYGDSFTRIARGGRWCEGEWSASMECLRVESADWADWGFGFRVAQNVASDAPPAIPAGFVKITGAKVAKSPATGGSFNGVVQSDPATYIPINTFYMAETELKYHRWYEVRQWALVHGYTFYSLGQETNNGYSGTAPLDMNSAVTNISWRDAIVWCNAASEMDGLTPVYWLAGTTDFTDAAKVLREAERDTVAANGTGKAENAVFNRNANGYRLPTEEEWEYAARGGNQNLDDWNYRWAGTDDEGSLDQYAAISIDSIDYVGQRQANAAGLYDMTGFQYEFCWKMNDASPVLYRGGYFRSTADNSQIDVIPSAVTFTPVFKQLGVGFRVVRSSVESGSTIGPRNIAMNMVYLAGDYVTTAVGDGNGAFVSAEGSPVTIDNFYIADSELTYAKWYEVYVWATTRTPASLRYLFANVGNQGSGGGSGGVWTTAEPVTNVSWRDAIVWCNAASEMEGLTPVYYYDGTANPAFTEANILREAESMTITAGTGKAEKAVVNPTANGYRLPTDAEWEYAARGGDQHDSTAWNYTYAGSDTISNVAVNGPSGTAVIKTKAPNTAGLFDMTGNVAEWCWDETNSNKRVTRGGDFGSPAGYLENDWMNDYSLSSADTSYGFRVARNAN